MSLEIASESWLTVSDGTVIISNSLSSMANIRFNLSYTYSTILRGFGHAFAKGE